MGLRTIIPILSFLFFLSPIVKAQDDSAFSADTAIINKYIDQAYNLVYDDPETVSTLLDSIISLSKEIDYHIGLYRAFNIEGIKYYMLGNMDEAKNGYLRALPYADDSIPTQKLNLYLNIALVHRGLFQDDSTLYYLEIVSKYAKKNDLPMPYARSQLNMAYLYLSKDDYVKTVPLLMRAAEVGESSFDSAFMIQVYGGLGLFYFKINDFENSHFFYQKAINLEIEFGGTNLLAILYSNVGELFFRVKEDYDTAIYYYRKSVEIELPFNKANTVFMADINIGNVYMEREELDSAFYYYSKGYHDPLYGKNPSFKAAILTNLGVYYHQKEEYNTARKFLIEGLSLSKSLEQLAYQKNALNVLWKLEETQGNYSKCLDYHKEYHQVSDSLNEKDAIQQLAIIEYNKSMLSEKYKNELLISQNSSQESQILTQRILIGVGLLSFFILLGFLYTLNKKKKEIKSLHKGLTRNYSAMENVNQILKIQEEEMKGLLMNKDRFVSILGHDLKNPFSGLLGLLELMDSDWDEMQDIEKKDSIRILYKTSVQTYQLLEGLLDWGKTQQGLIKSAPENIDLVVLLESVVSMFNIQAKKKNVSIHLDIPEGAQVYTDLKLSSQIIQNFLGNAIKYTHAGGNIFVKVDSKKKDYKINIIDQGIGIPANKIGSLFSLNSNFNRLGTENEKSTGMGLILCKEYANIIGGELTVTSEESIGSTFSLNIKKV